MAEFKFNTDLGPKQQNQTSIGDMVNLARGIQAYKQAEEINPLQVRQQSAVTQGAETDLNAKRMNYIVSSYASKINNPMVVQAETDPNSVDPNQLAKYIYDDGIRQAKELGIPEEKAIQLNQPYVDLAKNNPGQLRQYLKERMLTGMDTATRASTLGNIGVSTIPQSYPSERQPSKGVTAQDMNRPPSGMELTYPVRQAGVPYAALPQEAEDLKVGTTYKNQLTGTLPSLTKTNRNLDEVIKKASDIEAKMYTEPASLLGKAERGIRSAFNAEDYQQLRKDLANVVAANEAALGGTTDAGRALQASASGDETYSPKVLIDIANRAKGDTRNIQMQASAIQKFSKKFGDQNINAFKQSWAENADSRIFQGLNIMESNMSKEKKAEAIKELYRGASPEELQQLKIKQQNLFKLRDTGSL